MSSEESDENYNEWGQIISNKELRQEKQAQRRRAQGSDSDEDDPNELEKVRKANELEDWDMME